VLREDMPDPEQLAREEIDALLKPCGWDVQDKRAANLAAARGVAVRELTFKTGAPDYTLFVDGKAIGTIEAKPAGHSLTGVEEQSEKYVRGVPFGLPAWRSPLPFSYESTGTETRFISRLDPVPGAATSLPFIARRPCSHGWKSTLRRTRFRRSLNMPTVEATF
jgi:type I restriction enzyme, R subunit